MNKPLSLGVVSLFLGVSVIFAPTRFGNEERAAKQRIQDRFIGAWRLAWLEEPDPDGNLHRLDCTGLLVYTRDGHMSVQVMFRSPQSGTNAAAVQYAQGGYEASFGTYQINENAHTFIFHVEGALVRSLIGKDLSRLFELSGQQIIVKSSNPSEHWRVAWEHY